MTILRISAASIAILLLGPVYAQGDVARVDSNTDRVPLHTVIPVYPEVARRDRVQGSVQVCFNISRGGHARRIAVRQSTSRMFEKIAMKAVRKSTWLPLPKDKDLTGIKACRTFHFSLVPLSEDERD